MPKNHSSSPNIYPESVLLRKDGLFYRASKDRLSTMLFGIAKAYLKELSKSPNVPDSTVLAYLNYFYDTLFAHKNNNPLED